VAVRGSGGATLAPRISSDAERSQPTPRHLVLGDYQMAIDCAASSLNCVSLARKTGRRPYVCHIETRSFCRDCGREPQSC